MDNRLVLIGILLSFIILASMRTQAHNCDEGYVEQPPDCHYVQAVNPVTGKLEQHYVCT